ncbi:MAG: recombination mediator RecR [Clostridia bacterium]
MNDYIDPIAKLINQFTKLPSVGQKTAQRYALSVLKMNDADVAEFASTLLYAKQNVKYCSVCGNFTDIDPCHICSSRDNSTICVVCQARDVLLIEKTCAYRGVYHVLGGALNPMEGIGPNQLNIRNLLSRIKASTKEIIIATNADVEGEATAMYLARLIKPLNVKVTRLAQGVAIGSDLQYTDEVTLGRALENRKEI